MSSQLQIKMGEEWVDIEADDYHAWIARGYAVRALKLVVVSPKPSVAPEDILYQYRWIDKGTAGPWCNQGKDSHDLCVEQLTRAKKPRTDIQIRVVHMVQDGDIIGPKIEEVKKAV